MYELIVNLVDVSTFLLDPSGVPISFVPYPRATPEGRKSDHAVVGKLYEYRTPKGSYFYHYGCQPIVIKYTPLSNPGGVVLRFLYRCDQLNKDDQVLLKSYSIVTPLFTVRGSFFFDAAIPDKHRIPSTSRYGDLRKRF